MCQIYTMPAYLTTVLLYLYCLPWICHICYFCVPQFQLLFALSILLLHCYWNKQFIFNYFLIISKKNWRWRNKKYLMLSQNVAEDSTICDQELNQMQGHDCNTRSSILLGFLGSSIKPRYWAVIHFACSNKNRQESAWELHSLYSLNLIHNQTEGRIRRARGPARPRPF